MSPFGPFFCVFRWDLSQIDASKSQSSGSIRVKDAADGEYGTVAEVWYKGLASEEGNAWSDYLARWTPVKAAKWFLDYKNRFEAKVLVAEEDDAIIGISGIIPEKKSGIARMYTGVVVATDQRRKGVGSILLYTTLLESKRQGLHYSEVETRPGITASKYLYHKFGGIEKLVSA
ncbi:MAG TPA: GNAT family N-acetyltransferase [Candidatus Bathyarchaeia archaeon]|nr:GNAT family N-acetyltransferase [Candidatus Bathyarchaeia archaeon]